MKKTLQVDEPCTLVSRTMQLPLTSMSARKQKALWVCAGCSLAQLCCLCVGERGEVSVSEELEAVPCSLQCGSTSGFPGLLQGELLR